MIFDVVVKVIRTSKIKIIRWNYKTNPEWQLDDKLWWVSYEKKEFYIHFYSWVIIVFIWIPIIKIDKQWIKKWLKISQNDKILEK